MPARPAPRAMKWCRRRSQRRGVMLGAWSLHRRLARTLIGIPGLVAAEHDEQTRLTATKAKPNAAEIIQTVGTTTPDLLAPWAWLSRLGVTHVAMGSTGVYWRARTTPSRTTSRCCS